ncbi:hypothetical protein OHA77_29080 [Streptosporangium sp. NBC_01639]|nr:hypothetical protein OHA77_29080 [Streptosporangium sp. NBC_01639]
MSRIRPPRPIAVASVLAGAGGLTAVTLWAQTRTHAPLLGLDVALASLA